MFGVEEEAPLNMMYMNLGIYFDFKDFKSPKVWLWYTQRLDYPPKPFEHTLE